MRGSAVIITLSSAPRVNPAGANHGWATESFRDIAPITATEGGTLTLVFVVGSPTITSGKYAAANDVFSALPWKSSTVLVTFGVWIDEVII